MAKAKSLTIVPTDIKRVAKFMQMVIERRNTIPVLSYVCVSVKKGKARFTGTDLDMSIAIDVEAETSNIMGTFKFLMNSRAINALANAATTPLTIDVDPQHINITLGETKMTVNNRIPVEDFPFMAKSTQKSVDWEMSQGDADRAFRLSRHCISDQETRYYLNGIYLHQHPTDKTLRSVATDGHRMAIIDTNTKLDGMDKGVIIPKKAIDIMMQFCVKGGNEPVKFSATETKFTMELEGVEFITKVIDGTFPDYTRVIPAPTKDWSCHLNLEAIRQLKSLANVIEGVQGHRSQAAKIDFSNGEISIEYATEAVRMPISSHVIANDEDASVGVNIKYLYEQATAVNDFTAYTANKGDPIRIVGDDPQALFIIMPMRV
jgi:DNA polymerase-3 subunit beta